MNNRDNMVHEIDSKTVQREASVMKREDTDG